MKNAAFRFLQIKTTTVSINVDQQLRFHAGLFCGKGTGSLFGITAKLTTFNAIW